MKNLKTFEQLNEGLDLDLGKVKDDSALVDKAISDLKAKMALVSKENKTQPEKDKAVAKFMLEISKKIAESAKLMSIEAGLMIKLADEEIKNTPKV